MRQLALVTVFVCGFVTPAFAQLTPELIASGLTQPVAFVQDPSDPTVQMIVQQDGRVRLLKNRVLQTTDFLDIRSSVTNFGEMGLLGLAFAPDYFSTRRFFVNFINPQGNTVVARFTRSVTDPLRADATSRFDLLWPGGQRFITQPFSNHNGGNMAFGPDGFLYIGLGDGGNADDPFHMAQNQLSLLGKMLRIDVSVQDTDPEGYNVPSSNPFVGQAGVLSEIWSLGLRNPWRWSFDNPARGGTGALIIGDVGQSGWEEIDYEPAGRGGRNYGWRNREGAHSHITSLPAFSAPLINPIFEYGHPPGISVTGGYIYRGALLGSSFRGRYFFADFGTSRVWSLLLTVNPTTREATASDLREHTAELGQATQSPSSFGVDASGELYIVNYTGSVYRFSSTTPPAAATRSRPAAIPPVGTAVPRTIPGMDSRNPFPESSYIVVAVATDETERRTVMVWMLGRWLVADLDDETGLRELLRYVRAASMSTLMWRQRP